MRPLQPTMLWESVDAQTALRQRFQFASVEEAVCWLTETIVRTYAISMQSVDRIVISAYNLLAWLTTGDGLLIAKCCALVTAHDWLVNVAELLLWLDRQGLPVSIPLASKTGSRQVICDHLTLSVQRLLPGDLLDPTQPEQAHAVGVTLARLHQALAAYPRASDFAPAAPLPALRLTIQAWLAEKGLTLREPTLVAAGQVLGQSLSNGVMPELASQIVHHDYRAANLLWHAGQLRAVLDFEELRWGYRVNDLAWAAVHLGTRYHHWRPVSTQVHRSFLAGYAATCPLTLAEQQWLPGLMLWHSLNLTASVPAESRDSAVLDPIRTYTRQLAAKAEKGAV
jgi:homoserine kinase type II